MLTGRARELPADAAPPQPRRDGAVGGALAAGAGALLTFSLAARWPPTLLWNVLGPPPLPAALAALACSAALVAGAFAGRRTVAIRGRALRRGALAAVVLFVAYLLSILAAVALLFVVQYGVPALMVPFSIVGVGLAVCFVLLPWVALPLAGSAAILEGWTRSPPGGIGLAARRRARGLVIAMASASVALLAAVWG